MKRLIIIVLISILIGSIIFKLTDNKTSHVGQIVTKQESSNISPTSSPKPTLPPLNENSNLEEEINKLTPPDFSESINKLKEEIKNF